MTSREINQDEEFERLMDFVFGPLEPEPEGFGAPGPSLPPECKWCPECKEWDAGWDSLKRKEMRTELMALRILAKRTERGEKFSGDRTTSKRSQQTRQNKSAQCVAIKVAGHGRR